MTDIRIQRWSPDTCGCIIEQAVDYDDTNTPIGEVRFLMMNHVCDKHKPLASTRKSDNHAMFSAHVLSLIEQAKASNLKQCDDQIAKATRKKQKKELEQCRKLVLEFNANLDEEWAELVDQTHAFDSHIHDRIRSEQES